MNEIVIRITLPEGATVRVEKGGVEAPADAWAQATGRSMSEDEAQAFAGLEEEPVGAFPPIGSKTASRSLPLSTGDLLDRLEAASKVPAAAAWAKKRFGTGSFKNLTDEQRGQIATVFHVA